MEMMKKHPKGQEGFRQILEDKLVAELGKTRAIDGRHEIPRTSGGWTLEAHGHATYPDLVF